MSVVMHNLPELWFRFSLARYRKLYLNHKLNPA
jgi:hypothetical protein